MCTAEAFYFGGSGEESFGWLHLPPLHARPTVGLVLCSSFGIEDLSLHRSLRHIASEATSRCGIPALRFDYVNTGDSSGGDADQDANRDQLARWVKSVHVAIDALREAGGVQRVVLLGVRLGAMLAVLAASERADICACFAIAPVVRGRAYLREMRALQQATGAAGDAMTAVGGADTVFESGGFVLNAATQVALSTVDLTKLPRAPAPDVVIIERDDLSLPEKWPDALMNLGVNVSRLNVPGYAAMIDRPDRTQLPQAIVDVLCNRLTEWSVAAPLPAVHGGLEAVGPSKRRHSLDMQGAMEEPVTVPGTALFGVLTRPVGFAERACLGTVLMLNAGCIRRVGPSRVYVDLARSWARRGWWVFRLDVSGIGDSAAQAGSRDNDPYAASAAADVAAALAYLQSLPGAGKPGVVLGLCSGAYHSFKAAVSGAPMQRALMINPLTFFWKDGMSLDVDPASYQRSLTDGAKWRKLIRGQIKPLAVWRIVAGRMHKRCTRIMRSMARALGLSLQDDLVFELAMAARNAAPLQFVFSSSDPGESMLRDGGGAAVNRLQKQGDLTISRLDNADHIFTQLQARERLVRELDLLLNADH